MENFDHKLLKKIAVSEKKSYKGQNGKLTIVGGSHLFHGASLWSLKVASRIVDMVFYSSVEENNELTKFLKKSLYDFIATPRGDLDRYIEESDVVLIGPGLPRVGGEAEGEVGTKELTERLLKKYPHKKWVIDAGSLTEMDVDCLLDLKSEVILTPHDKEFKDLFNLDTSDENLMKMAKKYHCTILLKGVEDRVCDGVRCMKIGGGNQGMTKGGTGDCLAGLIAGLFCKNDAFSSAAVGSYVNKAAADELYRKVGIYYNASDLCDQIPSTLHRLTK